MCPPSKWCKMIFIMFSCSFSEFSAFPFKFLIFFWNLLEILLMDFWSSEKQFCFADLLFSMSVILSNSLLEPQKLVFWSSEIFSNSLLKPLKMVFWTSVSQFCYAKLLFCTSVIFSKSLLESQKLVSGLLSLSSKLFWYILQLIFLLLLCLLVIFWNTT